nr:hypothetical protein CFP56_60392 [Quercus suber]
MRKNCPYLDFKLLLNFQSQLTNLYCQKQRGWKFGGSADLVLQFNEISIRNLHQAGPGICGFGSWCGAKGQIGCCHSFYRRLYC